MKVMLMPFAIAAMFFSTGMLLQYTGWRAYRAQGLLPLNRSRRLGSNVIDHAVYALHFVHNPRGNIFQDVMRERDPVCGHTIFRTHCADRTGVSVGAHVAHYADGHYRKQHGERLPNLGIEAGI